MDVEGINPNFMISEVEFMTETEQEFPFKKQNDQLWTVDSCKVGISMDVKLEKPLNLKFN